MLESLYVKDFAIVGEAEIVFGPGMTVVTGETGAGKSLLVDALMLLAGGRADATMVRHGCERAELSATFDLAGRADLRDWLVAEDLDEDGACQLRRVVRSEGSSRAWINGRPVTLTQLKTLAAGLIEIHGQHEHQALLDRTRQLALLDAFGGHDAERDEVARAARAWRETNVRIAELSRGEDHAERIEWLGHQVEELDRHALAPDDLAALEERHRRLANSGQLLQGCAALAERLDGDGEYALLRLVARARHEITQLAALDERLAPIGELVEAARIQLGEANDALSRYQSALDLDPDSLAEAEAQLGKLHELARKHRVRMADLKAHADGLHEELETLRGAGASIASLREQQQRQRKAWDAAAKALGARRAASAKALSDAVSALMGELGMRGGRFEVQLETDGEADPDPQGAERCEFLVSANPGQPPRALRKVASGGELSRISLAIEVAALGSDTIGTMVFDEVDSGIGGAVAEVVGQKLHALGARAQVLCVTHLPQVAAQGDRHLRVSKSSDGASTETRIEALDGKPRQEEVARMLGGIDITRETLAHAKQMLGKRGLRAEG
ncbi:DNA repair protein RecN [Dokdonella fugitiva]|jgi:DNA repair protein RecN (Recombination protein N)|uniref:DNA repair protein RecN n=1 Tax=Dokdonella fugitiva TaxID=328517 RepID=A0A4R2HU26_9GAMM|nr:DNA repair protein RecN [Dokdonella fugitiva]TCO34832.1 DNA repair protein RecN (Recombination protein N) [Dokdonella fugitiva]